MTSLLRNRPLVMSLIKGVGNLCPPIPKFNFIWNVKQVLKYLRPCNLLQVLGKKILSLKLTILLVLTPNPERMKYGRYTPLSIMWQKLIASSFSQ